jgi:hypothetical protein
MNDWLTLVTLIVDSLPNLSPAEGLAGVMSLEAIAALELKAAKDIDATIRVFSRSQKWPKVSPRDSFFLYHRFAFGKLIADSLATPDKSAKVPRPSIFPSPAESFWLDSQLEWLLICAWDHAGRAFWVEHRLFAGP